MQRTIGTTAVVDRAAPAPAMPAAGRLRRRGPRHPGAAVATVCGALLRCTWLAYARPEPVSDFRHYLHAGLALVDTGTFGVGHPSAWRLPAYPAVLAVGSLMDRDLLALAALTTLIAVAQVALTYWVAWRIFGSRPAATTAATVAAVAPALVAFAPVLASEHLLAVTVLAALGTAVGPPRDRRPAGGDTRGGRGWLRALLAGILLGAGVLTRGEALAYLPVLVLVVAGRRWRDGARPGPTLAAGAMVVAGLALVVTPWVVRNERVVGPGAGLSTTGGFNFFLAHSPGGYGWRTPLPLPLLVTDEITRNTLGWRYGLQYVRRHPGDWWPTTQQGTRELLAPSTYAAHYATVARDPATGRTMPRDDLGLRRVAVDLTATTSRWLLWAGLLGVALVPAWRRCGWVAVVGVTVANWVVYAVVFWAQARYRFVVDALACVATGAIPVAAGRLRDRRGRARHRRR